MPLQHRICHFSRIFGCKPGACPHKRENCMDSRNRSSDVFGGGDVTSGGMVLHSKKLECVLRSACALYICFMSLKQWFLFTLAHRYIASYMEIGSQRCSLGKHCTSKDLRHIITAHGGNLASDLTKGGLVIGYHQTSAEIAAKIVHSDILPGTSGALGPGVYFAPTLDMTNGKAHRLGCVVVAIVDIGNPDIVTNWHPHFTGASLSVLPLTHILDLSFDAGESQKRRGFDSTVGVAGSGSIKRPEFVVYDRLVQKTRPQSWAIVFISLKRAAQWTSAQICDMHIGHRSSWHCSRALPRRLRSERRGIRGSVGEGEVPRIGRHFHKGASCRGLGCMYKN